MKATERIPVLVTPQQKEAIASRAKAANMAIGEFLRRAAESFRPTEDDEAVEQLLEQVKRTTAEASKAIDTALREIAASQKRIARMESARARKGSAAR